MQLKIFKTNMSLIDWSKVKKDLYKNELTEIELLRREIKKKNKIIGGYKSYLKTLKK
jgi:hypothetical protein